MKTKVMEELKKSGIDRINLRTVNKVTRTARDAEEAVQMYMEQEAPKAEDPDFVAWRKYRSCMTAIHDLCTNRAMVGEGSVNDMVTMMLVEEPKDAYEKAIAEYNRLIAEKAKESAQYFEGAKRYLAFVDPTATLEDYHKYNSTRKGNESC